MRFLLLSCLFGAAPASIPDYQPVPNWFATPDGVELGPVSAVAEDGAGLIYVLHRGKKPLLVLDRAGKLLRSWGDDTLKTGHGLRIDADRNLWITDIGSHQVFKFAPDGKVLLTLGQKNKPGVGLDQFDRPTDVAFAADDSFYVTDGYGNSRVLKFAKDGKLIKTWGKKGTAPGEFNLPHCVVTDAKGHVYVGDRENNRIQVFDAEGTFLTQWKESGAPYGLFRAGDRFFVADGRAQMVTILDADGKRLGRLGEKGKGAGQFGLPHMLCVDAAGALFVAEVENKRVQKFVAK